MAYPIYNPFNYSLGDTPGDTSKPTKPASREQAKAALQSMKRSLKSWLRVRSRMDEYVKGKRSAPALLRNPGAKPLPPSVAGQNLRQSRFATEQGLAQTLHSLLVESGCQQMLPPANVSVDPDAAVKLAQIVIDGCDGKGPAAQGLGVFWLVLVPVAGAVLVLSQLIKSKADVAKEQERIRCIESGACTDSGFWLKVASISVIGWLAWDKLGLKEKLK